MFFLFFSGYFVFLNHPRTDNIDPGEKIKYFALFSGGIITDSTIHDLDMCRWMSGSTPQTVYVQGNAFDPEIAKCNDLDHVLVTIKFENGVIANIDNGRADGYGYDNRLEVCVILNL